MKKIIEFVKAIFRAPFHFYHWARYGSDWGYSKFEKMDESKKWKPLDGSKRLDQVTMLASHNALMAKEEGWLFSQQLWSMKRQLDAGVRVLEFDMKLFNNELKICHNPPKGLPDAQTMYPYRTFSERLGEVFEWMDQHPDEIVVINLDIDRDKNIEPEHLDAVLERHKGRILTEKDFKDGQWPKIEEMRRLNKRLVINNFKRKKSEYTLRRFDRLVATVPTTSPKETVIKDLDKNGKAQPSKNVLRMLQHNAILSNQFYCYIYRVLQAVGLAKKVPPGKLRLSDNKVSTIQAAMDNRPFGDKKPNIIMLDDTHKFILDGGLELINQLNGVYTRIPE